MDGETVKRIGFVATRISGTDGVSLEVEKWAQVLERAGYECFYVAGRSDRAESKSFLIEEADFRHPEIERLTACCFGTHQRREETSRRIHDLAAHIKRQLKEAIRVLDLDMLIAENSLTIPMNIPLGVALVETILESGIAAIAHHHDFVWERDRFLVSSVSDYVQQAFPPKLSEIEHVVINSVAGREFSRRAGLSFRVIPNVMDFGNPPAPASCEAGQLRRALGIAADDILVLQPTRVVKRKAIEHSVELIRRLEDPRFKLVITHSSRDEGGDYARWLREFAEFMGVELIFAEDYVSHLGGVDAEGRTSCSIRDAYSEANLVSYPSTYEGFGNAFLEAVYYKKPVFCNRYPIFRSDIEPLGFRTIGMDGFLQRDVVDEVRRVVEDDAYREEVVEHNYRIGREHFSFSRVETDLCNLISGLRCGACHSAK